MLRQSLNLSIKNFFSILTLTCFFKFSEAQTLKGFVVDERQNPLSNSIVSFKETKLGAITDEKGFFEIKGIDVGKYILFVSQIGYKDFEKQVTLTNDSTLVLSIVLEASALSVNPVIVTATKNFKKEDEISVPVSVITKEEIQQQGLVRLDEILEEETGLSLTENHGTGVQVQGLDSDYTLILVDGEPLIGRTAGTFELSRVALGNVEQVDVVKGPSSSLYGSEALAGVINVITSKPQEPFSFSVNTRVGTHKSYDFGSTVEFQKERFSASLFLNRNSSNGYDLTPETESHTTPKFVDYTISPKIKYDFTKNLEFASSLRFNIQDQDNISIIADTLFLDEIASSTEFGLSNSVKYDFGESSKLTAKHYYSTFETEYDLNYQSGDSSYFEDPFSQDYNKSEVQINTILPYKNSFVSGTGFVKESVDADRINQGEQTTKAFFLFTQNEWLPTEKFSLTLGGRLDWHSDYSSKISPKVSTLIKPLSWLRFRGSVGSGFKAPTFQQLYLNFTNGAVGYSVFGSTNLEESLKKLEDDGLLQESFIDASGLEKIKAEKSIAYNFGFETNLREYANLEVNFFRNDIEDLIETSAVARKTNGQSVFSYFNLNEVYTQGFEAKVEIEPFLALSRKNIFKVTAGYNFLEAKDKKIEKEIEKGKIFKRDSEGVRPVTESEYGGLYNRSKHSGLVKLLYENKPIDLTSTLRLIYRSKYGFGDTNGNNILDDDSEYVKGYYLINFSVSWKFKKHFTLQFAGYNLNDKTDKQFISSLSGRTFFTGLKIQY